MFAIGIDLCSVEEIIPPEMKYRPLAKVIDLKSLWEGITDKGIGNASDDNLLEILVMTRTVKALDNAFRKSKDL